MSKIPQSPDTTPIVTRVPSPEPPTTTVTYAPTPRLAIDASTERWLGKQAPPSIVKVPPVPVKHGQYKDILDVFRGLGLFPRSAAILLSHLLAECGDPASSNVDGKRVPMSLEQVSTWAALLQKRCVLAWSAMSRGDIRGFVTFLGRYGIEHESPVDCELAVNRILRSEDNSPAQPHRTTLRQEVAG